MVCFCLCLIIVNIIGYMHFWGLTLDSVTIIMLIIALGLSVDYAAHIGRAFMEVPGTPDERLKLCLENMGVAVLNGAVSTFLAVLLLGRSQSYVFITFSASSSCASSSGSRTVCCCCRCSCPSSTPSPTPRARPDTELTRAETIRLSYLILSSAPSQGDARRRS